MQTNAFVTYGLSFQHTFLNIYDLFMTIYCKNDLAILENGKTFEFQFVRCHAIFDIASYLFCRVFATVI